MKYADTGRGTKVHAYDERTRLTLCGLPSLTSKRAEISNLRIFTLRSETEFVQNNVTCRICRQASRRDLGDEPDRIYE